MKLNLELNTLKSIMRDFYAVTKVRSSIYDGIIKKYYLIPTSIPQYARLCTAEQTHLLTANTVIYVHSNNVKKKKAPLYIPVISVSPKSLLLYGITT